MTSIAQLERDGASSPPKEGERLRLRLGWATFPLAVFFASRVVAGLLITIAGREQVALPQGAPGYSGGVGTGAHPNLLQLATNWDGQWYQRIAEDGYRSTLPTVDGAVVQNEWAFYPVYPFLVRTITTVTGIDFALAATLLSIVCGAAAFVLLYRMLLTTASTFTARATILCLAAYVATPILQVAYTESLALLIVLLGLRAVRAQRWKEILFYGLVLSLTRAIAPAFGVTVILCAALAYRTSERSAEDRRRLLRGVATGVTCVAMAGIWPSIAGIVTGEPSAYLHTMAAWGGYDGPVGGWFTGLLQSGVAGVFVLVVALVGLAGILLRPGAASWGRELRVWCLVYVAYILGATPPGPSVWRYLMLAAVPFWPIPEGQSAEAPRPASRTPQAVFLVCLMCVGLAAQWRWTTTTFIVHTVPLDQAFP